MDTYHYPAELFELLVEALPALTRSKESLLTFFRSVGVPTSELRPVRESLLLDSNSYSKYAIARRILTVLNERGDEMLAVRRELLRRVCEYEKFSTCYANQYHKAKALVADIQQLVNVRDSFTKMQQAHDKEVAAHQATARKELEQLQARQEEMEALKRDFYGLFVPQLTPQQRGKALEAIMNGLFKNAGILLRHAFVVCSDENGAAIEQIDGVVEIDGRAYLVEMKWWREKVGVPQVSEHLVRLFARTEVGGIFISYSDYTSSAIETCNSFLNQKVIVLSTLQEIVGVLDRGDSLESHFRAKIRAATIDRRSYLHIA